MNKYVGETFLSKLYREMHTNKDVIKYSNANDNKYQKIRKYLEKMDGVHRRLFEKDRLSLIKVFYYDKYIIKKEHILDGYFEHLEENSLNRGFGHVRYNNAIREREKETIINDQKKSLDIWIDYFVSHDSDIFPAWFKYYVFQSVVKLGSYDKSKNVYNQRTENTTAIFPDLNREALAIMYDYLNFYLNDKKDFDDKDLEKLIKGGSFKKIYVYLIKKLSLSNKKKNSDEGKWVKYDRGSDYIHLVKSLEGKGTGWCTAGVSVAKSQLSEGDFYVFYSYDNEDNPTIPRIAIRMEDDSIAEIRGIADGQHLEQEMEKVLNEKLIEFPDGEEYKKKSNDMESLTKIYKKEKNGKELSIKELRFLYEIDGFIEGFGYQNDPRIDEIIGKRNKISDLASIFNCNKTQIVESPDLIEEDTIIYCGDYYNMFSSLKNIKLPKCAVLGSVSLSNVNEICNYIFPLLIKGDLQINKGKILNNIIFPKKIMGDFDIRGVSKIFNVSFPDYVYGSLLLNSLVNVENVCLPKYVGRDLFLGKLEYCENFTLPEIVRGNLNLESLTSLKNIKLPTYIGGILNLKSLTSIEDLELPKDFNINNLIIRDNLKQELIRKNKIKVHKNYLQNSCK